MSSALSHVHKGFGVVRPYLHGPVDLPEFLQRRLTPSNFSATRMALRSCRSVTPCYG
jgi:hypothetical protein